jgi:hypothetical protein
MPWVGDLLRLGPDARDALSKGFCWIAVVVPKAGFRLENPVNVGALVTPKRGLGLSDGAGDSLLSFGDAVGMKAGDSFRSTGGLEVEPKLVLILFGEADHAEAPALA